MTEDYVELAEKFSENAVIRGQSIYFPVDEARHVVDFCRVRGWAVVGLEGIHLDCGALVADTGFIADFSEDEDRHDWPLYVQTCADAAERILTEWSTESDLLIDVVVLTCPDDAS
jgi:hypothetical protein